MLWYKSKEILYKDKGGSINEVNKIIKDLFEGLNKENGKENGKYLVKKIINFIRFKENKINFVDEVCVMYDLKNNSKDKILFNNEVESLVGN